MTDTEAGRAAARVSFGRLLLPGGAVLCVAALLAFSALQYAMPPGFDNTFGVNHPGVRHFQRHLLGGWAPRLEVADFGLAFLALTLLAWLGYLLAVAGILLRPESLPRRMPLFLLAAGAALAVCCPPSLSADVYGYAAYGRLQVLHGLNPYLTSPQTLRQLGDPAAGFAASDVPFVYGSLWLLVSLAVVAALQAAGLWWEILAFKLLAAAALLGAAWAGRVIADRRQPGSGAVALVAIGLNPLLLIEGPGNGHNDVLMMGLLLVAAALLPERLVAGAVCLGLSIGIKIVTAAAVPWVLLQQFRSTSTSPSNSSSSSTSPSTSTSPSSSTSPSPSNSPSSSSSPSFSTPARRLARFVAGVACMLVLILLPPALGYAPFWEGAATFTGLRIQTELRRLKTEEGPRRPASPPRSRLRGSKIQTPEPLSPSSPSSRLRGSKIQTPEPLSPSSPPSRLRGSKIQNPKSKIQNSGRLPPPAGRETAGALLARQWPVVVAYLALTLWLWRRGRPRDWLLAWAAVATLFVFWRSGLWFPWYFIWAYAPLMTRWDRACRWLNAAAGCIALFLMLAYSIAVQE